MGGIGIMGIFDDELLAGFSLPLLIPLLCSLITLLYIIGTVVYNLYFHPLRKFPGPKWASASSVPLMYAFAQGRVSFWIEELHNKYGDVVRISPTELSFISPAAWKDIYGYRAGHATFKKDMQYYMPSAGNIDDLLTAADENHARMRKLLEPAFSTKALRALDPVLTSFADRLVSKLDENACNEGGGVVDLLRWYSWTAFDLTGDLTFGQTFGCLDSATYHPWISLIFDNIKVVVYLNLCRRSPSLFKLLEWLTPASLRQKRIDHYNFSVARTNERLSMETKRPDFITQIQEGAQGKGMSTEEIHANAALLVIAGSETTSTILTGTTYYLLRNPIVLDKLIREVRTSFTSTAEINTASTATLPYLSAVLSEGLRHFPAVPIGLPRIVPPSGDFVSGHWVPGNTGVSVNQWSAYHSSAHFAEPYNFVPERWLSDEKETRFENDKQDACQPFNLGPRGCIGKNLANAEMRIILAKILWNFDIAFPDGQDQRDWAEQQMFTVWQKKPLFVKLISVR